MKLNTYIFWLTIFFKISTKKIDPISTHETPLETYTSIHKTVWSFSKAYYWKETVDLTEHVGCYVLEAFASQAFMYKLACSSLESVWHSHIFVCAHSTVNDYFVKLDFVPSFYTNATVIRVFVLTTLYVLTYLLNDWSTSRSDELLLCSIRFSSQKKLTGLPPPLQLATYYSFNALQ